eukprot:jgi/Bigna1/71691/fgenesh1_pg.16_\
MKAATSKILLLEVSVFLLCVVVVLFGHDHGISHRSLSLRLRGGKGKGGGGKGNKGSSSSSGGQAQIVTLKQGKKSFEVLAKSGAPAQFKEGKISAEEALEIEQVFNDARKLTKCSDAELQAAFGTNDQLKCCEKVLEKGDFSLTAHERKKKIEEKTEEIVSEIIRNYRSTLTKSVVAREQVEIAFKDAKIKIDSEKPARSQIDDILEKLQTSLSLYRMETDYVIRFNSKYGSALSVIKKYGQVKATTKDAADFFVVEVGIPPANYDDLMKGLSKPTSGKRKSDFEIDTVGSKNEPKAAKPEKGKKIVKESKDHHRQHNKEKKKERNRAKGK